MPVKNRMQIVTKIVIAFLKDTRYICNNLKMRGSTYDTGDFYFCFGQCDWQYYNVNGINKTYQKYMQSLCVL
jgi:hypothetical protein